MNRNIPGRRRPDATYASEKIIKVNRKYGNLNPASNQGTIRNVYDEVKLVTDTGTSKEYKFFDPTVQHQFPHTNLPLCKLEKNESMAVTQISLQIVLYGTTNGEITGIYDLYATGGSNVILASLLNMTFDNQRVIKDTSLVEMMAQFNPDANFGVVSPYTASTSAVAGPPVVTTYSTTIFNLTQTFMLLPTPLIIPELMQFFITLTVPQLRTLPYAGSDVYLRFTMSGLSYISSPKGNH